MIANYLQHTPVAVSLCLVWKSVNKWSRCLPRPPLSGIYTAMSSYDGVNTQSNTPQREPSLPIEARDYERLYPVKVK